MTRPDPSLLQDVVAPKVLEAMAIASAALRAAGIRHVVVGSLALGANGCPRNTRDVDFLVGDEAFERHAGGLVTLKAGVPFEVNGVPVDFISPRADEDFLAAELQAEPGSMIEAPALVYMKLKVSRLRDRADVVDLIKSGLDIDACRQYLSRYAPALVADFEKAIARARSEESDG